MLRTVSPQSALPKQMMAGEESELDKLRKALFDCDMLQKRIIGSCAEYMQEVSSTETKETQEPVDSSVAEVDLTKDASIQGSRSREVLSLGVCVFSHLVKMFSSYILLFAMVFAMVAGCSAFLPQILALGAGVSIYTLKVARPRPQGSRSAKLVQ